MSKRRTKSSEDTASGCVAYCIVGMFFYAAPGAVFSPKRRPEETTFRRTASDPGPYSLGHCSSVGTYLWDCLIFSSHMSLSYDKRGYEADTIKERLECAKEIIFYNEEIICVEPSKPAAILAAKDGSEISIQEAVSDRLWDYTFASMDDNITNAVHAMVAPCSREKYLEKYLWYFPENIVYP